MPFVQILLIATLSNFLIGTIVATTQAGVKLDSYKVDTSTITISGLSSGAIMAMQYHVAFSEQIRGAGILAGGRFLLQQISTICNLFNVTIFYLTAPVVS